MCLLFDADSSEIVDVSGPFQNKNSLHEVEFILSYSSRGRIHKGKEGKASRHQLKT